jgi:radical SAM-linked protein
MLVNQRRGRIEERDWTAEPRPEYVEPPAVQRLRFRIGRTGEARYLSHLEWNNAWIRTLRRARTPLSYSQGFHAHPKLNFATALPVGEETIGDYMDIVLKEYVEPSELLDRIQLTLPEGFMAYEAFEVPLRETALMAQVAGFEYAIRLRGRVPNDLAQRVEALALATELLLERKSKPKGRSKMRTKRCVDVRPMLESIELVKMEADTAEVVYTTVAINGSTLKPKETVFLLGAEIADVDICKRFTHLADFCAVKLP